METQASGEATSSAQEEPSQVLDNDASSGENRGGTAVNGPEDSMSGRETLRHGEGVNFAAQENGSSRIPGYRRVLTRIVANRSLTTTCAHASMGLALIAVGLAVQTLFVLRPISGQTQVASQVGDNDFVTLGPNNSMRYVYREDYVGFQPINGMNIPPASIRTYFCQAITCHPQLSLICIGVGCVFLFCSFSGGLMIYHKMKEYVCCHLVWVSISALCSITLSTACMMGLTTAYEQEKGLVTCTCTLIVTTILETVFCALDVFNMSNYFSPQRTSDSRERHSDAATDDANQIGETGRSASRNRSQQESGNSDTTFIRGGSRHAQQRSITIDITQERTRSDQTHSRSTRARGSRDRNLLHPGYQPNARHRGRRRPILRAQNHYVLVPAPIARSRAHSRSRVQGERRNRNEMPMFVIPNHDRYVRALNQSMETLETGFNRGSVPSNVLPSSPSYTTEPKSVEKRACEEKQNKEERVQMVNLPGKQLPRGDSREREVDNHEENESGRKLPQYHVDDQTAESQAMCEMSETQRVNGRQGAVYSVVKRCKNSTSEQKSKDEMQEQPSDSDRCSASIPTSLPFLQNVLADKLNLAASVVLDGEFREPRTRGSESCRASFVVDAKCPPPPPTPDLIAAEMPGPLYNTSSEGDFSTISNESTTTPTYDRSCLASVSSDSGLGDHSACGPARCTRGKTPRYYNVPLYGSPRISMELSSTGASSILCSLPPMSPKTPAYENIDVQPNSAGHDDKEDGAAFSFSPDMTN